MSLMTAQAALLQELTNGDGYGLDLIERVREATDGRVVLRQGSVYPALRNLEQEGYVKSYEGESAPGRSGRPRIYYHLTAKGARAAREQQTTLASFFGLAPAAT